MMGPSGSGKTTIGRLLSDKICGTFFDIDQIIIEKEKKTISEIFEMKGVNYFREKEVEVVKNLNYSCDYINIVSLGGGSITQSYILDSINSKGLKIYLEVDVETAINRISNFKDRPLLLYDKPEIAWTELFVKRKTIYENCDLKINSDNSIDEICKQIIEFITN
ncbi:MAG: hypothetical protein IPP08_05470 [Chlorobiota bacterium]|nr:MAG: hypothetical protein IPP08_05470 [Chlorobiota bacterium]